MYFEGSRDMFLPLLPMLFMGTEEETKAKAEPAIDKKLPIYEKVLTKWKLADVLYNTKLFQRSQKYHNEYADNFSDFSDIRKEL